MHLSNIKKDPSDFKHQNITWDIMDDTEILEYFILKRIRVKKIGKGKQISNWKMH